LSEVPQQNSTDHFRIEIFFSTFGYTQGRRYNFSHNSSHFPKFFKKFAYTVSLYIKLYKNRNLKVKQSQKNKAVIFKYKLWEKATEFIVSDISGNVWQLFGLGI